MKKANKIIGILLVLVAATGLLGQDLVEAIVAVVNDDIITLSEYKQEYASRMRMLRAQLQGEELAKQQDFMKENLLESLITDLLLLQEARKLGLNVTEQVRMTLENIKRENNLTSDEDLKRALAQQGITYEDFIKQMEQNMLKQNIIFSEVGRKIAIDDSEIVSYYKVHQEDFIEPIEYTLKMIYIAQEGKSPEEIESKKAQIDQKLELIREQSAYKQYATGQYYERTDSPEAAQYYYKLVIDNWPETNAARMAQAKMLPPGWARS